LYLADATVKNKAEICNFGKICPVESTKEKIKPTVVQENSHRSVDLLQQRQNWKGCSRIENETDKKFCVAHHSLEMVTCELNGM